MHFILSSSSEFVSCRIIFLDFVFSLFILSSNGQSYRLRYSWIFTIVKFHLEWQYKNERVENNLVNDNPAINTYMFGYVALTNNRLNIWKSLDSSSVCYVCVSLETPWNFRWVWDSIFFLSLFDVIIEMIFFLVAAWFGFSLFPIVIFRFFLLRFHYKRRNASVQAQKTHNERNIEFFSVFIHWMDGKHFNESNQISFVYKWMTTRRDVC